MLKKLTALLICAVMLSLSVTVNAAENYTKEDISKTIDGIISYKSAILKADDTASFVQKLSETTDNSETQWYIISLSKYGTDVTAVQSSMIKSAEKLYKSKSKATDFQRTALALYACGLNPEDINGYNLLSDGAYNSENVNKQGINAYVYALLSLDCANAKVPSDAKYDREYFIKKIIGLQLSDGGFTLMGKSADTDVTAMCLQALAPYKSDSTVKESIDRALNVLSKKQNEKGGYSSFGTVNSESVSQVISALVALDIDVQTDSRFIKNGNTLIDNLMSFKNSDGGFAHTENGKSNNIACYQALNSLVDLYKYMTKGNTEIFEFEETKKNNTDNGNSQQNSGNTDSGNSAVNIDSNDKNNSVNTGDITQKHNSESSNSDEYENQKMDSANGNYEPFTLASTPDSVAAKSEDNNNFIYYVSLIGLIAVAVVLIIIRLTVLRKNGEPFRLFGRKKGDK